MSNLFSRKNKKNIINLSFAEFAQNTVLYFYLQIDRVQIVFGEMADSAKGSG